LVAIGVSIATLVWKSKERELERLHGIAEGDGDKWRAHVKQAAKTLAGERTAFEAAKAGLLPPEGAKLDTSKLEADLAEVRKRADARAGDGLADDLRTVKLETRRSADEVARDLALARAHDALSKRDLETALAQARLALPAPASDERETLLSAVLAARLA